MINDEYELTLLLNSEPDVQDPIAIGCDTTEADSSIGADNIIIFLTEPVFRNIGLIFAVYRAIFVSPQSILRVCKGKRFRSHLCPAMVNDAIHEEDQVLL